MADILAEIDATLDAGVDVRLMAMLEELFPGTDDAEVPKDVSHPMPGFRFHAPSGWAGRHCGCHGADERVEPAWFDNDFYDDTDNIVMVAYDNSFSDFGYQGLGEDGLFYLHYEQRRQIGPFSETGIYTGVELATGRQWQDRKRGSSAKRYVQHDETGEVVSLVYIDEAVQWSQEQIETWMQWLTEGNGQ